MEGRDSQKEWFDEYVYKRYWKIFERDTATLSSTCRQLALGIGSVSILGLHGIHQSHPIMYASILFILVLFFISDGAQYLNSSLRFQSLAKRYDREIKNGITKDIYQLEEEPCMNILTNRFFSFKIFLLILASIIFLITLVIPIK